MQRQVDPRLDLKGVTSVRADEIPSVDYYPGVRKRTLLASQTPGGLRILQLILLGKHIPKIVPQIGPLRRQFNCTMHLLQCFVPMVVSHGSG